MSEHWHILGAGAIGGLFAARLSDAGIGVTLLTRQADAADCAQLRLLRGSQVHEYRLPQSGLDENDPLQQVLITTKAYAAREAVAAIAHRLRPDSRLLLLVNGMGVREELVADHPELWIGCGTTTEGAWRERPLQVHHAGEGQTLIGHPGQSTAPDFLRPWLQQLRDCSWSADIDAALWRKLAINCAINPLTALHEVCNGELASRAELNRKCHELVVEIAQVCAAAGQEQLAAGLQQTVDEVIAGTADNRSSMLQDRLAGSPTEIDYITGFLLRRAAELGLQCAANRALYRQLTAG